MVINTQSKVRFSAFPPLEITSKWMQDPKIRQLTVASFFRLLKDKRLFFGLFDQKMKLNKGGSFEPKKFSGNFFTGSLTGSESEIHRFDQPTEFIKLLCSIAYTLVVHSTSTEIIKPKFCTPHPKRTNKIVTITNSRQQ